jgi:hypothetical protein
MGVGEKWLFCDGVFVVKTWWMMSLTRYFDTMFLSGEKHATFCNFIFRQVLC